MNRSHSNKRTRRNLSCVLLLLGWLISPDAVSFGQAIQSRLSQCQHIVLKTNVLVNHVSIFTVESMPERSMFKFPDVQEAAAWIRLWGVPNSQAWRASIENKITPYLKKMRREYTVHMDELGPVNNPSMYPDVKNWCGLEFVLNMIPAPGNDYAVSMRMDLAFQKLIMCHSDCTSIDYDPRARDGDSGSADVRLLPLATESAWTRIMKNQGSRMDQFVQNTIEALVSRVVTGAFRD